MAPGQSMQYATSTSKADVFRPTTSGPGLTEEQESVQQAVSEEVDKRMNRALDDLKSKYERGERSIETSAKGPTGTTYREKEVRAIKEARAQKERLIENQQMYRAEKALRREDGPIDDHDEKFDSCVDDEDELDQLREQRLKQLKQAHQEKMDNVRRGHGSYTQIAEDEFLREVTASKKCVVHFFHTDFERCKIMDHHLRTIATKHIEAKFVKIDAAKTPFFVTKLTIRVIPTVIVFIDGIAKERLTGFDGLTDGLESGKEDEFKTSTLQTWLANAQAIEYDGTADVIANDSAALTYAALRAKMIRQGGCGDNLDDDDIDYEGLDEDEASTVLSPSSSFFSPQQSILGAVIS
mmetsp:Transcript_14125/g.18879  ORF Transcript_14125/g.18879 Transcript_14125/m.18879 type:complete len:352 (-) Transcript_14125:309-1364(-)|eukprot:CAMPEP_0197285648 /NCGR_PEP_ID=MMETSP0890-20130614/1029_1 /TAXON_ID=44058 ORGANISM="Aureoumbra lagunensis, Strain CCMP1510" /NCGR_SAMPLE_ID=MMETSP0890 /ASSEMBLY_ACC=CAM_ASM_000533 /LENGTH=351 /DNA_ID=CAMNT_0042753397 /DNA_START=53 /DNA_END=1108 /DNA_ORIENTATION=+